MANRVPGDGPVARIRVSYRGSVQGVGFRPHVYRIATELGLSGFVINTPEGALVEAEGTETALSRLLRRIVDDRPVLCSIHGCETTHLDPLGMAGFQIRESTDAGSATAVISADVATCADCLREVMDPRDRRYRYPFTNCTNCGPRYTIIRSLPYDRPNTSMAAFAMCDLCRAEYENPADRRFHAQPIACAGCGPSLALWDADGTVVAHGDEALRRAEAALMTGRVVAIKGLGGFHLMVDARNESAVKRLRERKRREAKPLALMCPSTAAVRTMCVVSTREHNLLTSPERPIVLLRKRRDRDTAVAPSVAPDNPTLGVMLPYTPLHHLLLADIAIPLVATSGNRSDEPICIDESEAVERLGGIADLLLVHDRPILRHVDDSVARLLLGRQQVLRRARGYAPLPFMAFGSERHILATGAHLKNAVALAAPGGVFVSQHIGDLDTVQAVDAHRAVSDDLCGTYGVQPDTIACDQHPDYASTWEAERRSSAPVRVQHHFAHVLSCMAESELTGRVLGVAWDGTGYGSDGTVWGGEFLDASPNGFRRLAHLRTFPLPGGDAAAREPRRSALGLLHAIQAAGGTPLEAPHLRRAFGDSEWQVLQRMVGTGTSCAATSSAGRLFDAIAALLGLAVVSRFEGEAAMLLEWQIRTNQRSRSYVIPVLHDRFPYVLDWEPCVRAIMADYAAHHQIRAIARGFHDALAESIVSVARLSGHSRVVLSGGCFQNRYLCEQAVRRLRLAGFRVYWHQRVPPNDGGIALGQIYAALHMEGDASACA